MLIENKEIAVSGRLLRTAKLTAEYYEYVDNPESFVAQLQEERVSVDLFTFLQETNDRRERYGTYQELESIAILPVTTYENWSKKQINDKTRNMIRKAEKKNVDIRLVEFTDNLVEGIRSIYNESQVRQGKRFTHYGKDFATLKRDHITYLERSEFIGAFHDAELIGFLKLVHGKGVSNVMQIVSKIAQRDKAPTNALLAKAVETCALRGVPQLHYGSWSTGGLGDFKKHHGFERVCIPRYFIPLTVTGRVGLRLGLHRKISDRLPQTWVEHLVAVRSKWNTAGFGRPPRN